MATSLKIDDDMKQRIRRLAEQRERSPHWIMRQAITEYVEREEERESFYQEAMDGWREYQETGLHITGEEFFEWISRWGTDAETAFPECHT